jgi:hypothetical protein
MRGVARDGRLNGKLRFTVLLVVVVVVVTG